MYSAELLRILQYLIKAKKKQILFYHQILPDHISRKHLTIKTNYCKKPLRYAQNML